MLRDFSSKHFLNGILKRNKRVQALNTYGQDNKVVDVMSFDSIPGPKCYPVIGTLYKYWPLVGKLCIIHNFCHFFIVFIYANSIC